jgi:hypothetical protein
MKVITTTTSRRKTDSSLDATLNPVELPSGEIVSWGVAFPRPGLAPPTRVDVAQPHDGGLDRRKCAERAV